MVNRQETQASQPAPATTGRVKARLASLLRSGSPELASGHALALAALIIAAIVWTMLSLQRGHIVGWLGDTDDAMRLVLVRDLLGGHGWWDQRVVRLQPPLGSYMHWSQLLTGVLAAAMWSVSRLTSPSFAEWAVRFCWPLLLILPGVAASLAAARRLATASALLPAAVLLLITPDLYIQFVPGRIDHHNVQIVLAVAAFAAVLFAPDNPKFAALTGLFSGLGLAIGLEALFFHALIGASVALRLASDKTKAPMAIAYGLTLTVATLACFAVQTPPGRWPLPYCDALGINVIFAVAIAGSGLAIVAGRSATLTTAMRTVAIAVVAALAATAWLATDPACLRGPFAAVDPRVRPFWFSHILEIQPWTKTIATDRTATVGEMAVAAISLAAAVFLVARRWRRPEAGALLALALVIVAIAANAEARRMQSYVAWFGVPAMAAAVDALGRARLRRRFLPMMILTLALSPTNLAFALNTSLNAVKGKRPGGASAAAISCFATSNFAELAKLPPGLVLSETDLGPFILAETRDSVLAAPYHRMSWGILAAHDVLDAPPDRAETMTRRLRVSYIADCPTYPMNVSPGSFGETLRVATPHWLEALARPGARLRIYRVRPSGADRPKPPGPGQASSMLNPPAMRPVG